MATTVQSSFHFFEHKEQNPDEFPSRGIGAAGLCLDEFPSRGIGVVGLCMNEFPSRGIGAGGLCVDEFPNRGIGVVSYFQSFHIEK